MKDDFGVYGKGFSGYIHYMTAYKQSQHSGSGNKPKRNKSTAGPGCITQILVLFSITTIAVLFICH